MISLTANADYGLSGQYIARITGRHSKYTFNREFVGRKGGKRGETSEADVDDAGLYECCDIEKRHGKASRFVLVVEVDGDLMKFNSDKEDAMTIAKAMDGGRSFSEIVVAHKADPEAAAALADSLALKKMLLNSPTENELNNEYTLPRAVGQYTAGTTVKQSDLQPVIKTEMARLEAKLTEFRLAGKPQHSGYEIVSAKAAEKRQVAQTTGTATDQCWAILQALPVKEAKKVLAALKGKLNPPVVSEPAAEQPSEPAATKPPVVSEPAAEPTV